MNFSIRAYKELGFVYSIGKINDYSIKVYRGSNEVYKTMIVDLPFDIRLLKILIDFVHFIAPYSEYEYYKQYFSEVFKNSRIFVEQVSNSKYVFAPIDKSGDFILDL